MMSCGHQPENVGGFNTKYTQKYINKSKSLKLNQVTNKKIKENWNRDKLLFVFIMIEWNKLSWAIKRINSYHLSSLTDKWWKNILDFSRTVGEVFINRENDDWKSPISMHRFVKIYLLFIELNEWMNE